MAKTENQHSQAVALTSKRGLVFTTCSTGLAFGIGLGSGCVFNSESPNDKGCFLHCYEHHHWRSSSNTTCDNGVGSQPATVSAHYYGVWCVPNDDHDDNFVIDLVAEAIDNGWTFGGTLGDIYDAHMVFLGWDVAKDCTDHLQDQGCTMADSTSICWEEFDIDDAAIAELQDTTQNSPTPDKIDPKPTTIASTETCNFEGPLPGGTGAGNGSPCNCSEPFGKIDDLVNCEDPQSCELHADLMINIKENFTVFYEEGVTLWFYDANGSEEAGIHIGGLDSYDESSVLAETLGLQNGDVIKDIAGVQIEYVEDAPSIITSLLEETETTMTIYRPSTSEEIEYNFVISEW